jgi:hypothetical protein
MRRLVYFPLLTALLFSLVIGCERKPEDLEVWRNAEGGFEKLTEWAKSPEEPMPVRERAVQILVEESQANTVGMIVTEVDAETGAKLANAALPSVQEMWKKQDFPSQKEIEESGGQAQVAGSVAVAAKDAAYFLQPTATGDAKAAYEAILAEWMSADQELRTQLGDTTLGQIAPRAGDKGIDAMMAWLREADKPSVVAGTLRRDASDEVKAAVAKVLNERAMKEHPEISNELEVAILETDHPNIVPYLERALRDEQAPAKLVDAAMDTYIRVQGPKATPMFVELVSNRAGLMRWVAAQRIMELRGKAGVLVTANALPLEAEGYEGEEGEDGFKKELEVFCNFVSTEMKKQDVGSIDDVLGRALESDRWPTVAVGVQCARTMGAASLKPKLEAVSDKTTLPKWGEKKTVAGFASETAAEL